MSLNIITHVLSNKEFLESFESFLGVYMHSPLTSSQYFYSAPQFQLYEGASCLIIPADSR